MMSKSNTVTASPNYHKAVNHANNRKSHIMLYVPQPTDQDAARLATAAADQTASFGNNGNSTTAS